MAAPTDPLNALHKRLERAATTARQGYRLALDWPRYAGVVGRRVARAMAAPKSAADEVWHRLHEGIADERAEALADWLSGDEEIEALDRRLPAAPNARELLSSHPYPDVYVWKLKRMFPAWSGTQPG